MTTDTQTNPVEHFIFDNQIEQIRIVVNGWGGAGFGVGRVKRHEMGRREHGGALIPGPYNYAYGIASVIDCYGGTAAEMKRLHAEGLLLRVNIGDRIHINGVVCEILEAPNRNIRFRELESEKSPTRMIIANDDKRVGLRIIADRMDGTAIVESIRGVHGFSGVFANVIVFGRLGCSNANADQIEWLKSQVETVKQWFRRGNGF